MGKDRLSYEDVLRIVELVKSTPFREFRLKVGEIEVHLRRTNGAAPPDGIPSTAPDAATGERTPRRPDGDFPEGSVVVDAPMVGTFYRAPAPGAAPYVEVGQRVERGATLCIIEVMKLLNSIAAEASGVVSEILVEDGKRVEYGEALMVIRPDPEDG